MITNALSALSENMPSSSQDGVNQLLAMSDAPVRQKVGEAFIAQMQNSSRVQSVFFGTPDTLLVTAAPEQTVWIGSIASALLALALSQVSSHGFAKTVNPNGAQNFINTNLIPGNPDFHAVATWNYEHLFATHCQTVDSTPIAFQAYSDGSLGSPQQWGTLLAQTMRSPAYINQEMIKLNPAVDPGGWYQRFYANLYKIKVLNNLELPDVMDSWGRYLGDRAHPDTIGWTIYDHMVAGIYSYATFFGQVQAATSLAKTDSGAHCRGGPGGGCLPYSNTTYGRRVNDWLEENAGLGGFINGPSNSNRS